MSFSPEIVAGVGRLAPTIPRGLVVGSHKLPPSWWAAPSPANKARILTRMLGSAPDGLAFFAVDVRMLASARAWIASAHAGAGALQLDHPHGARAQVGRALGRCPDLRGLRGLAALGAANSAQPAELARRRTISTSATASAEAIVYIMNALR